MKLVNSKIDYLVDFKENIVNVLVLENQDVMSYVVYDLWNQCAGNDGDFILSDKKELKLDKNMQLIINPFDIDFNNKKIISTLYNNLSQIANEYVEEKAYINANILSLLDDIILKDKYPNIEYSLDFSWNDIFKLYSVKIEDNTETLISRLIDYMNLISSYIDVKILTLVNIKSYLSENELIELYQSASYNKIQLLLIESIERKILSNEEVCIVDSDKCIIEKHTNITP